MPLAAVCHFSLSLCSVARASMPIRLAGHGIEWSGSGHWHWPHTSTTTNRASSPTELMVIEACTHCVRTHTDQTGFLCGAHHLVPLFGQQMHPALWRQWRARPRHNCARHNRTVTNWRGTLNSVSCLQSKSNYVPDCDFPSCLCLSRAPSQYPSQTDRASGRFFMASHVLRFLPPSARFNLLCPSCQIYN